MLNSGFVADMERVRPRLASIGGAEDSSLVGVDAPVAESGEEDDIFVMRIDEEGRDSLGFLEAEMLPRCAPVGGFVDAVAFSSEGLAASCVDRVGVARGDLDGAEAGLLLDRVPDREPCLAGAGGLPDSALGEADVEGSGDADRS